MNKLKNWLDKPITWKDYFMFGAVCSFIGMIYTAVVWIRFGLLDLKELFKKPEDNK